MKPTNKKVELVKVVAISAGNMKIVACPIKRKFASVLHADMRLKTGVQRLWIGQTGHTFYPPKLIPI